LKEPIISKAYIYTPLDFGELDIAEAEMEVHS
jgi:hypothetical protein